MQENDEGKEEKDEESVLVTTMAADAQLAPPTKTTYNVVLPYV